MMRKLSILVAGLIVVFSAVMALAEDEGPSGPRRRGRRRPGIRRRLRENLPEEIRELLRRRRSGEELTDEEKAKLEEFMENARKLRAEIKELLEKRRSGEELTDEEKAKLRKFMRRRRRRRRNHREGGDEGTAE